MKTISEIKLGDITKIDTYSPCDNIDCEYNFEVSFSGIDLSNKDQTVVLSSTYDRSNSYKSMFFLDPHDAIVLGTALIDKANEALNDAIVTRNVDKMLSILRNNISKGYVDTVVVKYKKDTSNRYINNQFIHVYNIYPIYKHGIKNNHFNFNIDLNITTFTTVDGEDIDKDNIKSIIIDRIKSLLKPEIYYCCLSEEDNNKLNDFTSFKIKLVNFKKIIEKDYEKSVAYNKSIKVTYKKNKERLLVNAQDRAERSAEIAKVISTMPKRADGTIDFNKAMEILYR